jgi:hypothetical protein
MKDKPLATRVTNEEDNVPLETADLEGGEEGIFNSTPRYFVSALSPLPMIGYFGREAQAVYLFDKVLLAIERDGKPHEDLRPIGIELRKLLGPVMEQGGGRCSLFCGAISIIITWATTFSGSALS